MYGRLRQRCICCLSAIRHTLIARALTNSSSRVGSAHGTLGGHDVVTTANPICMALDDFYEHVGSSDASRELQVLRSRLTLERSHHGPDAWRTWCDQVSDHVALEILLQDPYTRDARTKPSGYPGDARTLDYVYLRRYGDQQIS